MAIKDRINGLEHLGLPTNDMEATLKFYRGLGFEVAFRTVNEGTDVCFLKLKDVMIEAYENGEAAMRSGAIDHVALSVTDVGKVFEEVRAAGYETVEEEPRFLPFHRNGVRFFNVKGPNNETVEFSQML